MNRSGRSAAGLFGLFVAGLVVLGGCAGRDVRIEALREVAAATAPADAATPAEVVRRDPRAYLRMVAARCRELEQYTLDFTRYERRGLFGRMYGPEHIRCWFRRRPFSIRMKWKNEDLKYDESVYVEGRAENKVRFVTRWAVPFLAAPPGVNRVELLTPVRWGEAKRPLTDFGLERLMERTLNSLAAAGDDVTLTYQGLAQLAELGTLVHHLRLEYAPGRHRTPVQDLYIDARTDLPAGTVLKLPSGAVDAAYFYANLDTDVHLTDDDFMLPAERAAAGMDRTGDDTAGG